ncbi:hypothetical protein [Anatilimnocola floriformis]|uniref:hypothetical protein n=1 Tax=Anatilimnocola floriformis TaxID=2948575 RepID=UPI0020C4FD7A|nr:hypothetical protein [Anatilimnocola floriformis]
MTASAQLDKVLDAAVEEPGAEPAVDPLPLESRLDDQRRGASWQEIQENRGLLLSTLFFVTAALGLPLLWRSRAFSPLAKVLLTVVVLAYTSLLFWITWQVMLWSYHRVANSL